MSRAGRITDRGALPFSAFVEGRVNRNPLIMKTNLILVASASLNAALCAGWLLKLPPKAPPVVRAGEAVSISAAGAPSQGSQKLVTNVVTVVERAKLFDWRVLESEDYKQYVANLRAIGCPEKTIRDIITADVTELFREHARQSPGNRFEYWKPGLIGNAFDEKRVAQQQQQAKERRQMLQTLLGDSYSEKADPSGGLVMSPIEQMMGDILSLEKQTTMKAPEVKYAGQMLKIARSGAGEDSEAMRKVMTDKEAEILTVLTPDEKFEYELRLSQPAILLRMSMGEFEPTEEEFRQMFLAAKKCSDKFGFTVLARFGNADPGDGAATETLDALRSALGEHRFLEFQQQRLVATVRK